MSPKIKVPYLVCDQRSCPARFENATARTAADIRRAARKQGWKRTWDGRDLCPNHQSKP